MMFGNVNDYNCGGNAILDIFGKPYYFPLQKMRDLISIDLWPLPQNVHIIWWHWATLGSISEIILYNP